LGNNAFWKTRLTYDKQFEKAFISIEEAKKIAELQCTYYLI